MSQPYPGSPVPYGVPPSLLAPKHRSLRRTAIVSVVLMTLTCLAAVIQCLILWSSYDDVKRLVYGLLSEQELDRGLESVAGTGPILDLVSYLLLGTGIAFLIWLWQARENTEVFLPAHQQVPSYQGAYPGLPQVTGPHRHRQGWAVGSWVCPIVQFWYPLQVVQDVVRASEPPQQPGLVTSTGGLRGLLYGWWASWVAFWVILVGGSLYAGISMIVWLVQLVDAQDTSSTTGDYVDIYDLQDFMVGLALAVNIGFTVATVLLIAAALTISLVILRVTRWQDQRGPETQPYGPPPQYGPAQPQQLGGAYGPGRPGAGRPGAGGPGAGGPGAGGPGAGGPWAPPAGPPTFPSYGGYQHPRPPGGSPPWQRPG